MWVMTDAMLRQLRVCRPDSVVKGDRHHRAMAYRFPESEETHDDSPALFG
jgi:hypothetical protein